MGQRAAVSRPRGPLSAGSQCGQRPPLRWAELPARLFAARPAAPRPHLLARVRQALNGVDAGVRELLDVLGLDASLLRACVRRYVRLGAGGVASALPPHTAGNHS